MLESEEKWLKKIRTNMEELLPENETAEIDIFGVDVGEYIRAKLPGIYHSSGSSVRRKGV